ncbi:DUF4179 domain-containing protein [Halobacteria archaeon AArc-dxtr1]|nr:DUF4179 domain-containing protein [Halobacteria archaeon AArc-dxtr1]
MSSRLRTGKRIVAVLIAVAIVLAAGVVVGQSPSLFGVDEEPTASIEFEDQHGNGSAVTVDAVSLSDGGFVVIEDGSGSTIATSEYMGEGSHENVTIEADEEYEGELYGQLTATVYQDTTEDETYVGDEQEDESDRPYLADGHPVSDTATVTSEEGAVVDSFDVEALSVPASATTNESVTVTADVSNPTDRTDQQHVDLRVDGTVVERQLVDLETGSSQEVTFEVEPGTLAPGSQTVGVFTVSDGALTTVDVEFAGTPALAVVDGNESGVTASASLPGDGFVAVERADDGNAENETAAVDPLGVSEQLEAGDNESIPIEFEEPVDADEELVAVLYGGDVHEPENATVVEADDGGLLKVPFTLAEVAEGPVGDEPEIEEDDDGGEEDEGDGDEDEAETDDGEADGEEATEADN